MPRGIVAPKRLSPTSGPVSDFGANSSKAATPQSNQAKGATQSSKFRNVPVGAGKYNEGNIVRTQGNAKGTGVSGRPSALGIAAQDKMSAASQNPDGEANRPGSRRK